MNIYSLLLANQRYLHENTPTHRQRAPTEMDWEKFYQAPDQTLWQGRQDTPESSCFFQRIELLDITKQPSLNTNSETKFGLLGFKCDTGVTRNLGRPGAIEGPDSLRTALASIPIHRKNIQIYDTGNIVCNSKDLESAQAALGQAVGILLKLGITPILIGGGHEIAWGHFQGLAQHTLDNIGILNFDAHFDMRPLVENKFGSSGTPFLQIAHALKDAGKQFDYSCIGIQETSNTDQLFKTAQEYNVSVLTADQVNSQDINQGINFVDRVLANNRHVYLTICLDVFSAAYAPGVSAPQAYGLSPWQVIPLLRHLANTNKVLSYDIAELSPKYDHDGRTAKLAAKLVYEITHHHKNT